MTILKKKNHLSLQDTIVADIENKIEQKILKIGQLIPTEENLGKKYGVSRVTIRLALKKLIQKNLIFKKKGVGTFVNSKKINQTLSTAKTIIDALKEKKLKPIIKVLLNETVNAEKFILHALDIKKNKKAIHLRRLIFLNNSPYALLDTYLPEIFKGVADAIATPKNLQTTYEIFENQLDLVIKEAKYEISISKINKQMSKLLKLKNNSYCLKNTRITYSNRGKALEITNFYYPPEKANFEVILPRMDKNFLIRIK